ncbi:MAG: DUF4256 domain-containing protein [Gemmatimonadales bacterium]
MAAAPDLLLKTLMARFGANMPRHAGIDWSSVQARLLAAPKSLKVLREMERTGGEPDVIGRAVDSDGFLFVDCSPESPAGRRSLCYDRKALDARKANKPGGSAMEMASSMGITVLTEQQYRGLQELGEFDRKTSSWILTPPGIRALGGALFCDRRYDTVFTYHNGAESYYAGRGFRGLLQV